MHLEHTGVTAVNTVSRLTHLPVVIHWWTHSYTAVWPV